jgi:Domain of unknown function (DUF4328)
MADSILRGDTWWNQRDNGTWLKWDELSESWEAHPEGPPSEASSFGTGGRAFHSPRSVANALVLLLALSLIVAGIAFVSQISEASLLSRAESIGITFAEAESNDARQFAINMASLVLLVITGIVFIVWFHRCYRNLETLAVGRLRFGPGWAIGGWFVPVLSMWRPKQIANDIWRGSDPSAPRELVVSREDPVPGFLTLWWISWLLVNVMNTRIISPQTQNAPTIDVLQRNAWIQLVYIVVWAVGALLAIRVVREITSRQDARAARFSDSFVSRAGAGGR